MRGALDVAVRGLRRLRVNDINIVLLLHGALIILDLVRVKDDDQRALPVSLIIAQDLDQAVSGRIQIVLCQRAQLLPVMDDIVAVDEQASRQLFQVYPDLFPLLLMPRIALPVRDAPFLRTVCPGKDRHELLILAAFPAHRRFLHRLLQALLLRLHEGQRQMHMLLHFVPRHIKACPMRAEH